MTAVIIIAGYFIFPPTWIKPSLVCGYKVKDVVSFREKAGSIVAAVEHFATLHSSDKRHRAA